MASGNDRITYYNQAAFLSCNKLLGDTTYRFINGVQSVGVTSNILNMQVPDVGRARKTSIYYEPTQEISVERILTNYKFSDRIDGFLLDFYSVNGSFGSSYQESLILNNKNFGYLISNLSSVSMPEFDIKLVTEKSDKQNITAAPIDVMLYRKCLLKNISYNISSKDMLKEKLTFGNIISEKSTSAIPHTTDITSDSIKRSVFTRKDFDIENAILPIEISNFTSFGDILSGTEILGINSIDVSVNFSYVKTRDTGKMRGADNKNEVNYWTRVSFPLDIKFTINITARRDFQNNILNSNVNFTTDKRIVLPFKCTDYLDTTKKCWFTIDLGNKNCLTSISKTGGSTDGSLVEFSLEYMNTNNDFVTYINRSENFSTIEQSTEIY